MKGFAILSVVFLFFIHSILSAIVDERAYVVYDSTSDNWSVIKGEPKKKGSDAVAWAKYTASMNETGWDVFEVTTNSSFTDSLAAYGAGYLEGHLTYVSTWNAWKSFCNGTYWNYTSEFKTFVTGNDKWYRNQVSDPTENTDYWSQVGLVLQQFDGFLAGYNAKAPQSNQLTYLDLLTYTLQFEMWDIYTAAAQEDQLSSNHNMENHCSVLVKVTDDGKRLFAAHDTWSTYNTMLRTYKHYNLHYNAPSTQSNTISFSSYPGVMVSGDDFYVTSQNMAVMETTNSVFNKTLYQHTTIETVPYWIRVSVANRMASSGQTWSQTFSLYNSGTYNNQWIVVDYKQFTAGQPLQDNTLWILEQIPGYVVSSDMTKTLESSRYWASYNIPYYPFIYNISGYLENFEKSGNSFSWSECARAQIFRRDESVVQTLGDMKSIMRYNEYQVDPLSLGDACRGISARCDLNTPWALNTLNGYSAFGAIDSKVTDNTISVKNEAHAISGPSWESQPPFAWTKQFQYQPHFGQPIVFDFHYHSMKPEKK